MSTVQFQDERQDSYVRVTLNQHYRTVKVKRTTTARDTDCPNYSQGFNFSVPSANVDVTSIILQVYQAGTSYGKGQKTVMSHSFKTNILVVHWEYTKFSC